MFRLNADRGSVILLLYFKLCFVAQKMQLKENKLKSWTLRDVEIEEKEGVFFLFPPKRFPFLETKAGNLIGKFSFMGHFICLTQNASFLWTIFCFFFFQAFLTQYVLWNWACTAFWICWYEIFKLSLISIGNPKSVQTYNSDFILCSLLRFLSNQKNHRRDF